ncbi:hypothetical protein TCAL_04262 [Tigriopus californicus]|uniref:Roadblock/LAMTOR2 domain-containing protein n=1 Tax=Tigriopus californicus TaxID=6832 RepID=A0A553PKH5_TIGCA|nr:dynein light chain roadblock-type 2-like [Tigriopus californicus]XP_059095888.1 dynein light chain roadblock-type 2-like [Tigriopus californicus]TRY78187.1 hypothetical protein TCAL_04262 [Tigriopus californicus]|eukprot:TCALIF_04262-PA protein Name:"Similar to Dynlrb2 Dynein light chain roadblock-type 2 (Mus musculus)" AED:0.06 eAED:0.06 QI:50/1/0.5/1/1/1/2/0/125
MKRSDQTSARSSGPPKVNKKILLSEEMEVTLKRIQESKNVIGVIVINSEGMPVKSSLDSTLTVQYADLISQLCQQAQSVIRALDPTNDLDYFRVKSKKYEILIAPDSSYVLIVLQNPIVEELNVK